MGLSLHDGSVPLRMSGLGSRRLLAAAIQKAGLGGNGAILVDEVEHGLEPHRIAHLVRILIGQSESDSQVFTTTHSPSAIAEVGAPGICVVRTDRGNTSVVNVPLDEAFSALVRAKPDALLGRSVLVCEGPTEGGICWALDQHFQEAHGSFGLLGVVVADGGGNTYGPQRAIHLARLGYRVAFFGDSDVEPNPNRSIMEANGVTVFLWDGTVCTEERIAADTPTDSLQGFVDLACEVNEEDSLKSQITARLTQKTLPFELDVASWLTAGGDEADLRVALGKAANKGKWFKNWAGGKKLGTLAITKIMPAATTPASTTLAQLATWTTATEG